MAPGFHQRVRQLFDEALERPETERPSFVHAAGAGDTTLVQAVERLLRAHGASESFLENGSPVTEHIGRYLIRGELGRGAMGVVYDAIDPMIGRSVAVKMIHLEALTQPGEAEFLKDRLFREARSAGQLFHPGIVIIFDVGQEGDSAFITMERVDGPTLQQILTSGRPLETRKALDILRQTAAALDYAHRHGVVHRDIKPGNIMLHDGITAKVTDFGIAKIMTPQHATLTGVVMGTPSYMSPEQIEARTVDGRSDQYSLAVVAYEMLTGSRPFEADSMPTLAHLIVYENRPSARAANPALPIGVDVVFRRGLARFPEDRFGTCEEFCAALEAVFQQGKPSEPVESVAPAVAKPHRLETIVNPPVKPTVKRVVKRPARFFWYLAGAAAVLMAIGLALFFYQHADSRSKTAEVTASPVPRPAGDPVAPAAPVVRHFLADSPSINAGGSATLSWDVTGANEVVIDQGIGKVAAHGQVTVKPHASMTYRLAASSPAATAHASVSVTVNAKPVPASILARQVYNAAVLKRRDGRNEEALPLFRRAAEQGDTGAMEELGEMYRTGEGITQDGDEAVRWFRRAADGGNSSAMVFLGAMYLLGDGIPANEEEAARWFQKASSVNNPAGIYNLATMYENGQGVPANMDKAEELYRRAAQLGNSEARIRLSQLQSTHK